MLLDAAARDEVEFVLTMLRRVRVSVDVGAVMKERMRNVRCADVRGVSLLTFATKSIQGWL